MTKASATLSTTMDKEKGGEEWNLSDNEPLSKGSSVK